MGRKRSEKWFKNKRAFDEIIGDPYSKPEPTQGQYSALKSRSSVPVANITGSIGESKNAARPGPVDFFCDVEAGVKDGLATYAKGDGRENIYENVFINTYIVEDATKPVFEQKLRSQIEQTIGKIFIERSISPSSKYFTTIRKKA